MRIQPLHVFHYELLVPLAEVYLHQPLYCLVRETLLYQFGRVAADDGSFIGGQSLLACCFLSVILSKDFMNISRELLIEIIILN